MAVLNASIGIVAVLLSEEKGYARILTCILVNICFGTVLFIYNRRHGKIWLKKEYVVFALSFNLPLLLHYISQYILEQFDRVMIQKLVGIAQAGIFSVAYNAGIMMKIVTQSINNALVPWQYEQLEKKNFKEILGAYVYKPEGKVTLVPDSDKREAVTVSTAEADFKQED